MFFSERGAKSSCPYTQVIYTPKLGVRPTHPPSFPSHELCDNDCECIISSQNDESDEEGVDETVSYHRGVCSPYKIAKTILQRTGTCHRSRHDGRLYHKYRPVTIYITLTFNCVMFTDIVSD